MKHAKTQMKKLKKKNARLRKEIREHEQSLKWLFSKYSNLVLLLGAEKNVA